MTETARNDIEHPVQPWWLQGYGETPNEAEAFAIRERFNDVDLALLAFNAVQVATAHNHAKRLEYESENLQHLGLHLPSRRHFLPDQTTSEKQLEYESLAAREDRVGKFVAWFSRESHAAFVAQESLPAEQQFKSVSLELGGKRQFGNWEVTGPLDDMIRDLPRQLVEVEPALQKIIVYGTPKGNVFEHPKIVYAPDAKKSYEVHPHNTVGTKNIQRAMLLRERPVADIRIAGQSEIVITKKSFGVVLVDAMDLQLKELFLQSCDDIYKQRLNKIMVMHENILDSEAIDIATIAGKLFEIAVTAPAGSTKNILPTSAHYIQSVGEVFAKFRNKQY